jgi:hypothetical protein
VAGSTEPTPPQPLHEAPERPVQRPDGAAPDTAAAHAPRFSRHAPSRPVDTSRIWTCVVEWSAGYRKSVFRAMAAPAGQQRRKPIAQSPPIMWTLMADPEPSSPEIVAALRELMNALRDAGWERVEAGGAWYALRFVWRQDGEPRPIAPLTGKASTPE